MVRVLKFSISLITLVLTAISVISIFEPSIPFDVSATITSIVDAYQQTLRQPIRELLIGFGLEFHPPTIDGIIISVSLVYPAIFSTLLGGNYWKTAEEGPEHVVHYLYRKSPKIIQLLFLALAGGFMIVMVPIVAVFFFGVLLLAPIAMFEILFDPSIETAGNSDFQAVGIVTLATVLLPFILYLFLVVDKKVTLVRGMIEASKHYQRTLAVVILLLTLLIVDRFLP